MQAQNWFNVFNHKWQLEIDVELLNSWVFNYFTRTAVQVDVLLKMNLRLGSWVNFTFFVYKETDKKNNWHIHAPTKKPFNLQLPSTLRNILSAVRQK